MAAPTALPSHHVKGEVAENRPAYREGRIPKATKVKTLHFNHKPQEIKNTGSVTSVPAYRVARVLGSDPGWVFSLYMDLYYYSFPTTYNH